jgi:ferrous iron transport protein A
MAVVIIAASVAYLAGHVKNRLSGRGYPSCGGCREGRTCPGGGKKKSPARGRGGEEGRRERTLNDALVGESVTITCLRGEEGVCRRLREMGFCESAVVEKTAESGALICKVCDARVALSRDLARNILIDGVCRGGELMTGQPKGASMPLSALAVGRRAVITGFTVENEDCERVEEMGVTPGEEVEVVRHAPLGDPIEIRIRGYCLSLRRQEADLIQVAPR